MATVIPFPEPAPPAPILISSSPELFLLVALLEAMAPEALRQVSRKLIAIHCEVQDEPDLVDNSLRPVKILAYAQRDQR